MIERILIFLAGMATMFFLTWLAFEQVGKRKGKRYSLKFCNCTYPKPNVVWVHKDRFS